MALMVAYSSSFCSTSSSSSLCLQTSRPSSRRSIHSNLKLRLRLRLRLKVKAMGGSGVESEQDVLKKQAAEKAVESVRSGMVLGLGTGSTAAFAVAKIGELLKSGELKDIVGIPTSKKTEDQALSLGIPLSGLDEHPHIDLTIDGAQEVDKELTLVKGRGGALLREKMVAAASSKFIVIVDESKVVLGLGGSGLAMPVEVVPFCWDYNAQRLLWMFRKQGCKAKLRMNGDEPYITDNGNYIVGLYFKRPIKRSRAAAEAILSLEGVVEHGLFLDMASEVIVASTKHGLVVRSK